MARTTKACVVFRMEAAMQARLDAMRSKRARLPRPAHWRTEEEYQRQEKPLREQGWRANPWRSL
jgi:hypothetical protein